MKKLFFLPITAGFLFISCNKEEARVQPQACTKTVTHSSAKLKVDFNYTMVKDPVTGEYYCVPPKLDCCKITPDAAFSFTAIDAAIASGPSAVLTFFNTSGWENDFPFLEDETAIIDDLQDGVTTLVRESNSHGDLFYIVVPYANAYDYDTEDFIYISMHEAE